MRRGILMNKNHRRRILILGAGIMQGPAIRAAKEMGLETVVVDGSAGAPCAGEADRFEHIDLKDREGIEALALSLKKSPGGLGGVMTAGTDFSTSTAWIAERLNLSGIFYETALDASDKDRMRRCFKAHRVPSPEHIVLERDSKMKKPSFPFPMVVKPVDNMGSRGCRRVDNCGELKTAVRGALEFSRSRRVIIEEYMEGPEFSVDALVYKGEITICGFADRHIFFPPYFIEMGHTMPSSLDASQTKVLLDVFRAGVRALGIASGAAKGDIKLTSRGPMIGEIAARLSGGYMSGWTYPYASGVPVTRGAIQIALGEKPDQLEPRFFHTSAERAFISIPGRVRGIHGLDKARSVPGVRDLFLRAGQGSRVIFPENNVTKCGNILSAAPSRKEAAHSAETAVRSILIRLEAPDKETGAFLGEFGKEEAETFRFPPDAFSLSPSLMGELRALPDPSPGPVSPSLSALDFPGLIASDLKDYVGRSPKESLEAVRELTGLPLPLVSRTSPGPSLGRRFWSALVRGGYQGAVYFLDSLGK
jgi:biotin carboxylase